MARCVSEKRAEGEASSHQCAAGIGRTLPNRMVIFFIIGSCRLETSSGLTCLKGVEAGSNVPVARCVSENRAEGEATSHQCAV